MSGNIGTKDAATKQFLENRKDMVMDVCCATALTGLVGFMTIASGSLLAGAATIGFGVVGYSKVADLCQLIKNRRAEKRQHPQP